MSERLYCDGHILYGIQLGDSRQFDHGTEFPVEQLRAEAQALGPAKAAEFERILADLLAAGSLKPAAAMKSARDLAVDLDAKVAEIERLQAQVAALTAQGIAPSLLGAGVAVETTEGTPAKASKKSAE